MGEATPTVRRINTFHPTRPHEKQKEVLDHPARFKVLVAGRKWRKTSLGISWLIEGALESGLSCPYIAPSKVQAKNIVWDDHVARLLRHFREQELPYKTNEVELSISFPNGGKVQLFGVENKEALRGISNWARVVCDEYDDWLEDIWPLIIRPNLITHRAPAVIMGTPKGKRGLWRFFQTKEPNWKSFRFTSYDNPDLDPDELDELVTEYKGKGEDYFKQEIMAEFVKPVGTVYKEFDEVLQYKDFGYDANLPVFITWDFGVNDPTVVEWWQRNGAEWRLFDYYEATDANIEHFVQVINSKPYKKAELHTGDIAGRARSLQTGKSVVEELAARGIHVRTSAIPDISTQIRKAHKYIPSVFISKSNENCTRFLDAMLNYRYPEKREGLQNQSNEIPIHDQWSHAMRAMEYLFWNIEGTEGNDGVDLSSLEEHLFDESGFYR